jgi:hypothetical protein
MPIFVKGTETHLPEIVPSHANEPREPRRSSWEIATPSASRLAFEVSMDCRYPRHELRFRFHESGANVSSRGSIGPFGHGRTCNIEA